LFFQKSEFLEGLERKLLKNTITIQTLYLDNDSVFIPEAKWVRFSSFCETWVTLIAGKLVGFEMKISQNRK